MWTNYALLKENARALTAGKDVEGVVLNRLTLLCEAEANNPSREIQVEDQQTIRWREPVYD